MPPKIACLLTFDYELPLGRSFVPASEALFEPTAKILAVCDKLNTKVTLFPDVCSVWAHRKFGLNDFADKFEEQLKQSILSGHDVELHIHPHWLNSKFQNNEWLISTDKMYLHELGFGNTEESAGGLINRGVDYLDRLLKPVASDYKCMAFRAAGLALQPDDDKLFEALLAGGIKMDTSISKGLKLKSDTITINYLKMPDMSHWFISPNTGIAQASSAGILEIPIGSFQTGILSRWGFLYRRLRSVGQMRGIGISRSEHQTKFTTIRTLIFQNLRYLTGNPWYILSCDTKGFTTKMLLDGFKQYINRHNNQEIVFVSIMNHPKLMFDAQIDMMAAFIKQTRQEYNIAFVTCRQAFDIIVNKKLP